MFAGWGSFFALLGEAGAGLIGLLFVVVTLTAGSSRSAVQTGGAFYTTPTALAFGIVLAISAAALAPRLPPLAMAAVTGLGAADGLFHGLRSWIGIRGGTAPHWTDMWFYGVAPSVLYGALAAAAIGQAASAAWATWATAFVLLALLLLAARNAWDLVTWLAPKAARPGAGQKETLE